MEKVATAMDNDNQQEFSQQDADALYYYTLSQRLKAMQRQAKAPSYLGSQAYTKENIRKWLIRPATYEKYLRSISRYAYETSGQYRRLCDYQPNMLKYSYVLYPAKRLADNVSDEDKQIYAKSYNTAALLLEGMNIKNEFRKLLAASVREGVAYGYVKGDKNAYSICVLDADFCRISGTDLYGCIRYEYDFRYFDYFNDSDREALLEGLGQEFMEKYVEYCNNRRKYWKPIGTNGICLKWDESILQYSTPPYVATIDSIFDIEDYKQLAKAKEEAGNYNLMGFTIPTTKDGKILMDLNLAKRFIDQASSELPSTIGVLLSPMQMEKFNFSKPNAVADQNAVADAEEQFWASTGTSNLLFGTGKSSANALAKSIIADEINIFPLLHQVGNWINRFLAMQKGKYKFKVRFLEVTAFNQNDTFDMLLKAGNAGVPVKNAIAATLGLTPYEVLAMAELENDVLYMRDTIYGQPLKSSSTMSGDKSTEGGRPEKKEDDLSPEGEKTKENERNIRE